MAVLKISRLKIHLTALSEKRSEQVMLKEYVDRKTAERLIENIIVF